MQTSEKTYDIVKTDLYVDRNAVNQALAGIGAYEPIQFGQVAAGIHRDALNEWVPGAGNWYFRPKRAGLYLITAQWLGDHGAALEYNDYIAVALVVGGLQQESRLRTYRAAGPVPLPHPPKLTALRYLTPNNDLQIHAASNVAASIDGAVNWTWLQIVRVK